MGTVTIMGGLMRSAINLASSSGILHSLEEEKGLLKTNMKILLGGISFPFQQYIDLETAT
jgi:hypothetical protein